MTKDRLKEIEARANTNSTCCPPGMHPVKGEPCRYHRDVPWLLSELKHWKGAAIKTEHFIEQTLAGALGYSKYGPDALGAPGDYAVGEHTSESLALEAADTIRAYRQYLKTGDCPNSGRLEVHPCPFCESPIAKKNERLRTALERIRHSKDRDSLGNHKCCGGYLGCDCDQLTAREVLAGDE